jgi:F-type H+-transporting ATPase subunit b
MPLWHRFGLAILVLLASVSQAAAQEAGQGSADNLGPWKITNTILFAIGLGFLIAKYAPAFFNARSADIQKAIKDATGLKMDADLRYSEIDRKMATLAEEIARIRDQARIDMEREHARVRQETEQGIHRIQQNVAAEIEAFRQEGMRKVRQQTAQTALTVAEQQLRNRLAATTPDDLIHEFVALVERGNN